MANCLRLPLSITVHLPEWHNILKEYLSFIPDRSHFQGLRACAPFPVALLMPISVEWDASCLTSLSSNSRLLGLWFQHWSSWVMPLPGWWLKSSAYVTANSKIGIRWLTMSFICSASSPTSSHDSPAASSNLTKWACLLSSLCIARAATGTSCHWFGHSACHWDWSSPCAHHIAFTSRGVCFFSPQGYWAVLNMAQ